MMVFCRAYEETEDERVLSREENSWLVRNLALSPDNVEVRFAYNEQTDRLIYEGTDTPETIRTTFTYDDFGILSCKIRYIFRIN